LLPASADDEKKDGCIRIIPNKDKTDDIDAVIATTPKDPTNYPST
jgi:hypothetical protein